MFNWLHKRLPSWEKMGDSFQTWERIEHVTQHRRGKVVCLITVIADTWKKDAKGTDRYVINWCRVVRRRWFYSLLFPFEIVFGALWFEAIFVYCLQHKAEIEINPLSLSAAKELKWKSAGEQIKAFLWFFWCNIIPTCSIKPWYYKQFLNDLESSHGFLAVCWQMPALQPLE